MAAGALMLASCSTNEGKSIDQLENATAGDSLVYYFGEINGAQYLTTAKNDSTLATEASKQAYIKGVKDGLNSFRPEQESYNRGVMLGLQMARNISSFKEDYNVQLNKQVFIQGLVAALNSDSVQNINDVQKEFNRIMTDFNNNKEKIDQDAANVNLEKEAAKLKLAKINDSLYGGAISRNVGAPIKNGDAVTAKISFTTAAGKELQIPLPTSVKVGARNLPTPLNDALLVLQDGQTGKFATSAFALFGRRSEQFDLQPKDVVIMTITANLDAEQGDNNDQQ